MFNNNDIVIDEEFRDLLPPLPGEVYEELERSIRSEGCRDAIALWGDVIVDGHNRYAICMKHGLPFQTFEKDFESREEAKIWIISRQFARRQLTRDEITYYRGIQYNLVKETWGGDRKSSGHNVPLISEDEDIPKTAERVAKKYNVTERTVRRDGKTAEVIDKIGTSSPDAKQKILSGKANISKKELEKLNDASDEEISAVAGKIADGTYSKKDKSEVKAVVPESDADTANTQTPIKKPAIIQPDTSSANHSDEHAYKPEPAPDAQIEAQTETPPDATAEHKAEFVQETLKESSLKSASEVIAEPIPEPTPEAVTVTEPQSSPEPEPAKKITLPDGWTMPAPIPGKKQTWCAFITAGIYALDSVICNIEKDIREKLPLVETQAERDSIRELFQSYINRQSELIKRI